MTALKLQLEDFFLTKMSVVWHPPAKETTVSSEFRFGYDVRRHKDDKRRFRLDFTLQAIPKEKEPIVGYEIESHISGLFAFSEGTSEEEMQQLIRVNGGTVLYGVLRGHIATVTGCFPGGKFTLPTVMMQDVVQDIEAERTAHARKNQAAHGVLERKSTSIKTVLK